MMYFFSFFFFVSSVRYHEVYFKSYLKLVTNFFQDNNDSFSCVRVSKFISRFRSIKGSYYYYLYMCMVAGFYIKTKEMGKLKEKRRGSKKSLRKTEGKGQGRVKGTKEKRKDWKSIEVGKE